MTIYRVNEIFYSIQGEGRWAGAPTVFVRLSGCTRKCSFCDTDHSQYEEMNEFELYGTILRVHEDPPRITFTGGEPLIYDLYPVIGLTKCPIHIETNGEGECPPPPLTWVTFSPKCPSTKQLRCDEHKFLCGLDLPEWEYIIDTFQGPNSYLQPIYGEHYKENLNMAIEYVKSHPDFTLSLQLHKLIGVR